MATTRLASATETAGTTRLVMMSDALLAQSAVDRLTAGAHTLIFEGPSYRQRTRPSHSAVLDSQS